MQTERLLELPDFPFKDIFLKFYEEEGVDFYFVGGFVRDLLLNQKVKDIDIVAEGIDYIECAKMLNSYIKGAFVTFKDNVRITKGGSTIDVSKLRGNTLTDDLKKRDFTINNLAYHFKKGLIGDTSDLENKVIRAVSDETFVDDPLRVLRGYRFVSQFGFEIEQNTRRLMMEAKSLLNKVAYERVIKELDETFCGDYFLTAFDIMVEDGIFLDIFPIFNSIKELYGGVYHIEDVLSHTFSVVKVLYPMIKNFNNTDKVVLILSALLHDIGKGDERFKSTPGKFVGHEEISAKLAEKELKRLTYPTKLIREVCSLVKKHGQIRKYSTNGAKEITLLRFIYENFDLLDKLMVLSIADAQSKNRCDISFNETIKSINLLREKIDLSKKSLIGGEDLMQMGVEKGPELGKLLTDIHFRLVSGIFNSKDDVEKYVRMKLKEIKTN